MFTCSFSTSTFRCLLSLPVNFAFSCSSTSCLLWVRFFAHSFKQARGTVWGIALVPFTSCSTQCRPPNCAASAYTPRLSDPPASTFRCAVGHGGKLVSQSQAQNGDCKGFASHPGKQQLTKKSWPVRISIFYSQVSWHIGLLKLKPYSISLRYLVSCHFP